MARLIAAALACLAISSAHVLADSLAYRNARFGTTVSFPAEIFREAMEPPANGDGMTFLSADGASLAVHAMNNALGVSPEELADQVSERDDAGFEVTYRRVKGDWAVLSGHEDGQIFYRRFEFGKDDVIHGLLIKYPPSRRDFYDPLAGEIAASFAGP